MPTYSARMIPDSSIPNSHIREHCSTYHSQITTIGRTQGQQVHAERYAPADGVKLLDFALYTVIKIVQTTLGSPAPPKGQKIRRNWVGVPSLSCFDVYKGVGTCTC
jgi:hypothetical protein